MEGKRERKELEERKGWERSIEGGRGSGEKGKEGGATMKGNGGGSKQKGVYETHRT